MSLPPMPTLAEIAPMDWDAYFARIFIAAKGLPGYLVCLNCASVVAAGEQKRHHDSVHAFKGF